eukprot:CAMPEP_0202850972 /NCGR_PEP_ID=MMETSP1389-20130828/85049_1 /ASSEMBLY_ACC=CAM_ASM_000865 /TAXON_ID=302021 /ORGANISM="Rhodomonas sp., Strain CCMP768" /LENGTH=33 /DNA_ID= /DNA_START= /DNA_END= /DNA_ORIENTATION=
MAPHVPLHSARQSGGACPMKKVTPLEIIGAQNI